jgi:hypothetical protein
MSKQMKVTESLIESTPDRIVELKADDLASVTGGWALGAAIHIAHGMTGTTDRTKFDTWGRRKNP